MPKAEVDGTLFQRTIAGLAWTGLGTGGQTLAQFVVLVILARLLTPDEFGAVGAAMMVVGISGIFSHLGLGPAIVQRPHLERRHVQTAFSVSVLLGVLSYVIVFLGAPAVEKFFRMDGLAALLRIDGDLAHPTSFVIDKQGIVRYQYVGRSLSDRPGLKDLIKECKKVEASKP